jgi:hypothetical protein
MMLKKASGWVVKHFEVDHWRGRSTLHPDTQQEKYYAPHQDTIEAITTFIDRLVH